MFSNSFWGQNGFEELRKHMKSGNEFCKEVGSIIQERAEAELTFSKSLSRLSTKLSRTCTLGLGSLSQAWTLAASNMEAQAELHKQLSQSLLDDVSKPMKTLAETQHKTRKPMESAVEKSLKLYNERRGEEVKLKKQASSACKEREKMCDSLLYSRSAKGKTLTDKELAKLEKKARQCEDQVNKVDQEYLDSCRKAESGRQEWEAAVYKACSSLQNLEEERISQMQEFLNVYNRSLSVLGPHLSKSCDKLSEAVISVDQVSDIKQAVDQKGTGPNVPEQLLPDLYAEEKHNTMDKERREAALNSYLNYTTQHLTTELKGREGVEKLMDLYINKPNYGDAEAQAETRQKLGQLQATIAYLQAAHHKFSCALSELEGQPKPTSHFTRHMQRNKDKQGQFVTILKMPVSDLMTDGALSRGPADGGHVEPYVVESVAANNRGSMRPLSTSSVGSLRRAPQPPTHPTIYPPAAANNQPGNRETYYPFGPDEFDAPLSPLCQARAIYDYTRQQGDELSMSQGDVMQVYEQQDDGWWQVELNGQSGVVPATYVEILTTAADQ